MPMNRRSFLKTSAAVGAGLAFPVSLFAQPRGGRLLAPRGTLSVVQGATDDSKSQFSVVHPAADEIFAEVLGPAGQIPLDRVQTFRFPGQATAVSHIFVAGLTPGVDYTLSLAAGPIKDSRIFRALDPAPATLRFAICSCMHERHHEPEIWRDLAARGPDVILFIGDSTYADQESALAGEATPATLWRRFSEARAALEIYHLPRLVPILAVWDDHDFGDNDANSVGYRYVKESQANFRTFFPMDPAYCRFLHQGPGIAGAFQCRGQNLVLLDDRSFRLPRGDSSPHAHWGREQEEWMLGLVRGHEGASWLLNGSQFFPSWALKESVSRDHPAQLAGLVRQLRAMDRRVIFSSGDVHYSEISRLEPELLGYETFEVTSSSIHSVAFPGFPGIVPNKRRILSTGNRNYVLVTAGAAGSASDYLVESRAPGTRQLFAKEIRL